MRRRTRTEKRWVMSPRNLKAFMAAAAAPAAQRLGFVGLDRTAPDAQGNGGPEVGRTPAQEETGREEMPASWAGVDRTYTVGATHQ